MQYLTWVIERTRSWGYTRYFFSIICQKPVNFEENTNGVHFKIKISRLKNVRVNAGSINSPFCRVSIYSTRKKLLLFCCLQLVLLLLLFYITVVIFCLIHILQISMVQESRMVKQFCSSFLILKVEKYIQKLYIWDGNQVNGYLQLQFMDVATKVDREILVNVFKRKKESKNRVIQRLDQQSHVSIIATCLRSRNALSQSLCRKRRREYVFLVSQTQIERLQKTFLPYNDNISKFKRKRIDIPYFIRIFCNHCLYGRSHLRFKVGK